MFKIQIPNNNIPERRYSIDIIFKEFLELEYNVEETSERDYKITLPNNKDLIIKDAFFSHFPEPLDYLDKINIPEEPRFSVNRFTVEENVPIIFGYDHIVYDENLIECGIDIFASSFFMLTRWEENVITEKDKHGRIADNKQYTIKHNIHYRPVVNEYVELLRNMFSFLGVKLDQTKEFKTIITHDIDFFLRYDKKIKVFKAFLGDIINRNSFKTAFQTIKDYRKIRRAEKKDPYNTFDYLMDLSEKNENHSIFYFIPSLEGEPDASYDITDPRVISMIGHIRTRGHIIGIHGAYRSYLNIKEYKEEIDRISNVNEIKDVRQHFLRFENPTTWQIQEELGFEFDSTLGFMNDAGFRAGTCSEYSLFNILTRRKLDLKEKPLIVMEQALRKRYLNKDEFYDTFVELKELVRKYKGNFVLLWHNNNFLIPEWTEYKPYYEQIICND